MPTSLAPKWIIRALALCITLILITTLAAMPTSLVIASSLKAQAPTPAADGSETEAAAFVQAGDQLYSEYNFGQAQENYDRALTIYKTAGDRGAVVYVLIKMGNLNLEIGEYWQALQYYQESWPEGEASSLDSVSIIYLQLGDLETAFQYGQKALALERAEGDVLGEAHCLNNLGVIYSRLGDYEKASKYFQEAMSKGQVSDALRSTTLNNIGDNYARQSDYQNALDYLFQALTIRQNLGNPIRVVNTLITIAGVYEGLGDYEKAIEYYERAISESEKANYLLGQAQVLNGIGRLLVLVGHYEAAFEVFQRALATTQELGGNSEGEATLLANIGFIYFRIGDYAKSLGYYQNALTIFRATGHRLGEIQILSVIGGMYDDLGNPQKAIEYHQQALSNSQEIGFMAGEIHFSTNIGLVYEEEGDYQKAFEYYSQAIAIVELVRERLMIEELRAAPLTGISEIYEHAILSLLKLNRPIDAFHYAERARARAFLDFLGNRQIHPKESENLELIEQEQQVGAEISEIERQLRQVQMSSALETRTREIDELKAALEAKQREYLQILFDLQLSNPEYGSLVGISPMNVDEVQQMLTNQAPDTILVTYFVGDHETAIFVISADSFQVALVPVDREELRMQAENLRQQMKKDPIISDAWQATANRLYEWLLMPIQDYLPETSKTPSRLGIIPHDLLHYIPFGLLSNGENILLDDHTLFYAPSVSSLKFIFEKRHPEADTLLAIANPNAPPNPYLFHAVEEVQAAAALYNTQPLINNDATEDRFKREAGGYGIIHIAAHSNYNPENPLFSAILLGEGQGEDGRLETHEIFDLNLAATDLVVLSACETHLGELSSGDELMGMERAFIRAGTPSLVSSLWSVDDAATAKLMSQFYAHLREGFSKGDALRIAQLETREEYPDPYYWAGFVLVGDHGESRRDFTEMDEKGSLPAWSVVGIAVVFTGVVALFWHRRRRAMLKQY